MSRKKYVFIIFFLVIIITFIHKNNIYANVGFEHLDTIQRNVVQFDGDNAYDDNSSTISDWIFYLKGADGETKEAFCCARGLKYSTEYYLGDGRAGFDATTYNKLAALFKWDKLGYYFNQRYQKQILTWFITSGGEIDAKAIDTMVSGDHSLNATLSDVDNDANLDDDERKTEYVDAVTNYLNRHSEVIDLFLMALDLANSDNWSDFDDIVYYKSSTALGYLAALKLYLNSNIDTENYDEGVINIYSPESSNTQPMLIVGDPLKEANRYDIRFVLRENSSTDYYNVYETPWYEGEPDAEIVTSKYGDYTHDYDKYHYDGHDCDYCLCNNKGDEDCRFKLSADQMSVYFYFTKYTVNIHHTIIDEDGIYHQIYHGDSACTDTHYIGTGDTIEDENGLCASYYTRTNVSFDSNESNVDESHGLGDNGKGYKIVFNDNKDIDVYYRYTPGKIIVNKIRYWDTYNNMPNDIGTIVDADAHYESINKYLTEARLKAILDEAGVDQDNSYNFVNSYDGLKYVGYTKIDENDDSNQKTGGYGDTSISYNYGKKNVYIYLYYEKRNISYSYEDSGNSEISNIKQSYIKALNDYIAEYNKNGANYSVDFEKSFSNKVYNAHDVKNDNYLKYNFKKISYGVKQMKLPTSGDDKDFKFQLSAKSSNYLSITNGNIKLSKVSSSVLDHALSLDLNGKYTVEPSVRVYVRHMIKQSDGSYAQDNSFANENEIATCKELGFTSLQKVNNGYSERKTVYYAGDDLSNFSSLVKTVGLSGYSEYFEIDKADKLIINRSGTILKDGKIYNCDGYVRTYTNDRSFDNITKASQNYTSSSNLQITFENSSKNKIYIDYYYTPESYSEDSASTIGNNSNLNFTSYYNNGGGYQKFNNSTDSTVEGNTYVPSSEYLRPSIVAEICRPRNVKYTISTDGTNPTYDLNNYTAYAINSTSSNIIGTVNGITGSNDRNKVYELGNNTKVYLTDNGRANIQNVKNNSIDTLRNSSTTSQIFKSNNIKTTLGNITSSKTQKEDFSVQGDHKVGNTYLNGYRNPTGTTYYREYNLLNGASYDASNGTITDERADNVIIYTPAKIKEVKVKSSDDVVDHSEVNKNNVSVIQQNADFTITVNPEENGSYDTVYDAFKQIQKYITATYVAFDFDVKLLDSRTIWDKADNYTKKNVGAGTIVSAGSIIKLKDYEISTASKSVTAKFNAYSTSQETSTAVKASYGNMKVFASTKNQISEDYVISQIKQSSLKSSDSPSSKPYIDSGFIERRTTIYNQESGLESLIADASYACSKFQKTVALGRIFDFEITDCLDVNFKNVFRENVDNSAVNKQTGIAYYSGVRSLLLRDSIKAYNTNYYRARENTQRGYVSTILPLGPYKNTSNEYIEAPKLGYRIAYNVKTSGYYNPKETSEMVRSIKIVPSYYYISKTGDMSTYNDKIQIYYKNKSGKYVKFEGSDYSIGFKPNDGYRTLLTDDTTPNLDNLSINIQKLKISGEYTLDSNTMITTSDAGFIQSWYGEFKLPNSAIALAEDENGKVDINKPLTDGYIGVKFDIYCTDTYKDSATGESTVVTLSYNRNNKNDGRTNTTQWDYEGYMNYDVNNQNSFTNMRLRFEKGTLTIANNEDYQKIRGTVVFYDTDARAAEDFD